MNNKSDDSTLYDLNSMIDGSINMLNKFEPTTGISS